MSGMARPVIHNDQLRLTLLDTTAALVAERGPAGVTLRDLAAAAGTSTTAIYSLFGGKAQLLEAVVNHGFASFGAAQEAAADGGLRALGIAYRRWALDHPALYRLMFGGLLNLKESRQDPPEPESEITLQPLLSAIRAGQERETLRDGSPQEMAAVIWAQVHGMVSLEMAGLGSPTADRDAQYLAALDAIERAWAS
ncbi:AcrR family transcriptional regulator [Arthrobacter woluwensis]|nr:AcrR family transcriptional regulator [Arthrobacter woluwensis]